MMLEENPLFHAAAVDERVPSGLQRPAYWELYCFTDCWRHVRNRWPRPNTAFLAACVPGGLFALEVIPALWLRFWNYHLSFADRVRHGPM